SVLRAPRGDQGGSRALRRGVILSLFALLVVLAGCGGSTAVKQSTAPSTKSVKPAVVAYLERKELTYRWVACIRNGRRYRGQAIVRCNVNFGMDPHVEAYCTVFD